MFFNGPERTGTIMKRMGLFALLPLCAEAVEFQTVHSSAQIYFENKTFTNSKQKTEGTGKIVTLEHRFNTHMLKAAYERTDTETKAHMSTAELNSAVFS